ncbi:hypothetical protein C8Q72DRAFT_577374, partial [Fomitopsis betulina]
IQPPCALATGCSHPPIALFDLRRLSTSLFTTVTLFTAHKMRLTTAFSLLLATVASVPAIMAFDFADNGMELQARMDGAEFPHYARRSLDDVELFVRSLNDDELLAVRDAANLWFDTRAFDAGHERREFVELEARIRDGSPPPPYKTHDPVNGSKPKYRTKDRHPPPAYSEHGRREFVEIERRIRDGSPPPPYRTHDPVNGSKPKYRTKDRWPKPEYSEHDPKDKDKGKEQGHGKREIEYWW